jgi:hypothetical protein
MKFNIQGLRDQGMNDRQINRYITKAQRDFYRQMRKNPKLRLPGVSVDPVKVSNMGLGSAEDASPTQSALQRDIGKAAPTFVGAMKKGGGAKNYEKGGKINLGACSVSTASKSKKSPNW